MSAFNLTLKPAQTELIATPGATLTQAYNVINNSDSSLVLNSQVLPFEPDGTDGSVTYDNVAPNPDFQFSLANSDLVLGQSFLLKPHENRQIVLKVKLNSNTPLADSYFTFFVSQDLSNSLGNDGNSTAATARIGSHLLISASKTENTNSIFSVSGFKVSPTLKDIFYPPLKITALINNESNYYNKIDGQLVISKNNLVLQEISLFPDNVLALHSRQVRCLKDNHPVPCTLTPPFWPGSYTATLTVADKSSTVTFFVFPYSLVLFLIVLASVIYLLSRRQTKKI